MIKNLASIFKDAIILDKKLKIDAELAKKILEKSIPTLENLNDWTEEALHAIIVKMAEETLAGTNVTSRDVLSDKYDRLMYSERFLTDEQMEKITQLATELDI